MSEEQANEQRHPDPRRGAKIGLVVVLLLVVGGLYLVHVLRATSQLQDCVMSGRTNCAPVDGSGTGN